MTADSFSLELASASIDLADVAGTLVPVVGKTLAHWANRNTRALVEARDEMFRDWVVEEKRATVEHARRLTEQAGDLEALRAKLEELISDPSFGRVRDNYGYEAAREALHERRRMLAYASAGSANVELTISQIARVERTIRELDPENIGLLAKLAAIVDPPPSGLEANSETSATWTNQANGAAHVRAVLVLEDPTGEVLLASGCVLLFTVKPPAGMISSPIEGAAVTQIGQWVLAVLDGYIRANQP
jgi:hypothetical protein